MYGPKTRTNSPFMPLVAAVVAVAMIGPASAASAQTAGPRQTPQPRVMSPSAVQRAKPPKRGAALRDAEIGKRALQLTPVQERAMAAVRARYSPQVKALVARLNALVEHSAHPAQQQTVPDVVKATEDTLRQTINAEHAALDSLITPDQRQRFLDGMRRAYAQASAPPPGAITPETGSSARRSTNPNNH